MRRTTAIAPVSTGTLAPKRGSVAGYVLHDHGRSGQLSGQLLVSPQQSIDLRIQLGLTRGPRAPSHTQERIGDPRQSRDHYDRMFRDL
jgi:hypothetical protein